MNWELWLGFALASLVLLVIPGPTILLVVGKSLQGRGRGVWHTVAGVVLGDLVALTLSLAGLGAVLSASAHAFTVLKWVGAAYLLWLGVRMWRAGPPRWSVQAGAAESSRGRMGDAAHVFLVTALNPKGIVFFVAFLPQFLDPARPMVPQLVVLGATFLVLGGLNAAAYALLAGQVSRRLSAPGRWKPMNRLGGGLLMGAGLMTAAIRRAA